MKIVLITLILILAHNVLLWFFLSLSIRLIMFNHKQRESKIMHNSRAIGQFSVWAHLYIINVNVNECDGILYINWNKNIFNSQGWWEQKRRKKNEMKRKEKKTLSNCMNRESWVAILIWFYIPYFYIWFNWKQLLLNYCFGR